MVMVVRMKFWRRSILLLLSCFLLHTLLVYFLLDRKVHISDRDSLVSESETLHQNIYGKMKLSSDHFDQAVCIAAHPLLPHPSNMSSLDIFHDAQFNVLGDGMYELPSPPSDFMDLDDNIDSGTMNVIVVPHSHVDPGWLRTTSEYYSDKVKHILNNMVNKLTEHPDMTFIWAETIFFALWWNELDDAVKVHVRRVIRRGQLEIVSGGWVMPDEASTHYVAIIDQLMEGHQWVWENLQVKPTNSWSIDPFGHSGAVPYLWKLAGMEHMIIQRVHQGVKASLMSRGSLEFRWRQFWDPNNTTDILCHVMPYMLYGIKHSCGPNRFICMLFDFKWTAEDLPRTRIQSITERNVEEFAGYLYRQLRQKSFFYKHNTVLLPVGDDFRYHSELEWEQQYGNYTRLMRYMNRRQDWKVNIRFGTLSDFFQLSDPQRNPQLASLLRARNTDIETLSGDFFPYSDRNDEYWTGFYSTRPFDKRFQREVQSMIQAADISVTLAYVLYRRLRRDVRSRFSHLASLMQSAHRAQAQFLHHDGISGTSKDFVAVDYEMQLLTAYNNTQTVMSTALQALITQGRMETPTLLRFETVRPTHSTAPSKRRLTVTDDGLRVFVSNTLPIHREQPVYVLLDTDKFYVKDFRRHVVPCQINPVFDEESAGVKSAVFEVMFLAVLPPLATMPYVFFRHAIVSAKTFPAHLHLFNSPVPAVHQQLLFQVEHHAVGANAEPIVMQNEDVCLRVDPRNGCLLDILDRKTGNVTELNMQLVVYRSGGGGAYLLQPLSDPSPLISSIPAISVVEGPLLVRLTVHFAPYVTQSFTLYRGCTVFSSPIHISNTLNIQTLQGREVAMRMRTDLRYAGVRFFTDQNGMQFIRRGTSGRLPLGANYYPTTSAAFLDDGHRRVSLLTAQPHGAASLGSGWLEVMLDRNVVRNDGRGLGEGVRDIKPARSDFILMVEERSSVQGHLHGDGRSSAHFAFASLHSIVASSYLTRPVELLYSLVECDVLFASFQPMKAPLPCDTSLISLRSLSTRNLNYNGTSAVLHRHAYDCDFPVQSDLLCDVSHSPLTFDGLFQTFDEVLQSVSVTSLTHLHNLQSLNLTAKFDLQPMQIASFLLRF